MKTFEELPVWQASRQLVREVYASTRSLRDLGFCNQIQRAAVSVPSKTAEGHERGSTQDLLNYLFIAKGSVGEVRSQLYHAEDLGYLNAGEADRLRAKCLEITRQLSAWIQSMQTPGFRGGSRYHKEPDRSLEKFYQKRGFARLADGRIVEVREPRLEYGKRKTGKRKKSP